MGNKECSGGYHNVAGVCWKNTTTVGLSCPSSHPEQRGALCYARCPEGARRRNENLEFCEFDCPVGFRSIGMGGCERPRREVKSQTLNMINTDFDANFSPDHALKAYVPR